MLSASASSRALLPTVMEPSCVTIDERIERNGSFTALGHKTFFVYDIAHRITAEGNSNVACFPLGCEDWTFIYPGIMTSSEWQQASSTHCAWCAHSGSESEMYLNGVVALSLQAERRITRYFSGVIVLYCNV